VSDKRPLSSLNDAIISFGATRNVNGVTWTANQVLMLFPRPGRTVDWNTNCAVKGTGGDSNGNRSVSENAAEVVGSWATPPFLRKEELQVARFVGQRKGISELRYRSPVIITVAWRDLATTVAKKWNGNQMQIWLPFVFYTPVIYPSFCKPGKASRITLQTRKQNCSSEVL
jgi:hypothetical protein